MGNKEKPFLIFLWVVCAICTICIAYIALRMSLGYQVCEVWK
jgi:hypothetical protein